MAGALFKMSEEITLFNQINIWTKSNFIQQFIDKYLCQLYKKLRCHDIISKPFDHQWDKLLN